MKMDACVKKQQHYELQIQINKMSRIQSFSVTVVNAHATENRSFILGSGLVEEQGQILDGAFKGVEDGAETSLTAAGSPGRIEALLNFIKQNPVLVRKMKFKSTSSEQTEVTINYKRESPFRTLGDENIALATFTNENTVKDNVVTVSREFQFDDQSKLTVPVAPDSTLTLTFEIPAVVNGADYAAKLLAEG